jgi:hypothetical protein
MQFDSGFELQSLSVHEAIVPCDPRVSRVNGLHPSCPKRLGKLSMDPGRACMIR